jgi:alkylated DNA repair dioxygenase AlkB
METDDLRREETKFMVAGTQLEREKQLMDKRAKLEQAITEEQVYAKLWMLDAEKKLEREKREAFEKKKKVADTMNILTWQCDQRNNVSQAEKERRLREQEMLKQQWQIEAEADTKAEKEKFILNRERNIELINHNAAERELRQIQQ